MMVGPDGNPIVPDHHLPMTTEQNKALARAFFARFSASDLDGALATLTDDATWLIPGNRDRIPTAGLYTKERIARLFHAMLKQLKDGLRMTVLSAIAEGDRVALEVESSGDLQNGRLYRQRYHFLLEFRDGRICAVREYLDTQHAHDVWIVAASTEGTTQ
jgi:ketosteroid isomerase-like protein